MEVSQSCGQSENLRYSSHGRENEAGSSRAGQRDSRGDAAELAAPDSGRNGGDAGSGGRTGLTVHAVRAELTEAFGEDGVNRVASIFKGGKYEALARACLVARQLNGVRRRRALRDRFHQMH